MKKKTIEAWLCELPEPYRSKALSNTSPDRANKEVDSLVIAVWEAFTWRDTEEGNNYWMNLKDTIEKEGLQSLINKTNNNE